MTDVIGRPQVLREKSVGASFGDAFLAARLLDDTLDIDAWNPAADTLEPRPGPYEELYALYGSLHEASRDTQHALAARQQ